MEEQEQRRSPESPDTLVTFFALLFMEFTNDNSGYPIYHYINMRVA